MEGEWRLEQELKLTRLGPLGVGVGTGFRRAAWASSGTKDSASPSRPGQGQLAQAALSPGLDLPGIDFPACLRVVIKGCLPGGLFKRDWNLESWSN